MPHTTQDPIRVGIAGLGRSGWAIHAHLLAPLTEKFQIVAVTDEDATRRGEAIDRFDCQAYPTYDELLADHAVELVVVSLPSFLHAPASLAALKANKHAICEKPMAISMEEADAMVAAAAATDRVFSIFQQRRYNPDFVKVREIIDSGILGRIVQIRIAESKFTRRWDWQTLQKFGGGSLNNTGAHFLDQALQLFGPASPTVFCELDRSLTLGDADDHVKLVFTALDSPVLDIEISSCDAFPPPNWHIFGTQGGLTGTTRSLRWKWIVPEEQASRTLDVRPTPDRSYNRDELNWREDSWEFTGDVNDAYRGFYHDLHATIREGAPLAITPESVRRTMWLQEECHRLAPLSREFA
jgi:predicted dehydrogenase